MASAKEMPKQNTQMYAEIIPPRILPRILTRFDLITIYFALIFGSYGAAQMAAGGWAAIPMLLLATFTFLVPCAMCAYELGTLFPGEGGIYIWAHKTFGPIHGFIAGWLSWVPIFLLLPLGATTIVAYLQVAFRAAWPLWVQVGLQILVVLAITVISIFHLRLSQGYVRVMFFVALGTAIVAIAAGIAWHGPNTPVTSDVYSLNLAKHGALFSVAILWLLGVEVPFNMGAEFKEHRRTAGTMFLWGSITLVIAYILGIVGVLLTTPIDKIDATTGVARAVMTVSMPLGIVVAIAIVFAISSQDVAYMNSYSRLLFISGIERRLPEVVGQVTERTRVPLPALLVQALGASFVILIFSTQANLAVAFNLYIAALITVWCASLFYIYFGVLRARSRYSDQYKQRAGEVWQIPGGRFGLILVFLIGAIFNSAAIYYVFALPLTPDITAHSWRMWLGGISLVVVACGTLIFKLSEKRVKRLTLDSALAKYAHFDPPTEK